METYTEHILAQHIEYVSTELLAYEEITVIEQHTASDKDILWTSMVNHLCHCRYRCHIPDPEEFAAFLDNHERLKKAMATSDVFFATRARQKRKAKQTRYWRKKELVAKRGERAADGKGAGDPEAPIA